MVFGLTADHPQYRFRNETMSEPENDLPLDDDLELALAAFGDDLRDILNEDEDEALNPTGSDIDCMNSANPVIETDESSESVDPIEYLLDRFGDKLNDDTNLAYAGSIALECLTAGDSPGKNTPRFVVFGIGKQKFAVPLACVVEVTANVDVIAFLPRTADWLKGVTCLRGTMLSVTDVAALFQIPSSNDEQSNKMIVINSNELGVSTGLWVDRIHGIRNLDPKPLPKTDDNDPLNDAVHGIGELGDESVLMIDPDRLFGSPQLSQYTH